MKYKIIDLFCGMGGIRRGFELADCECVLSADIDKRAIKQYKHLYNDDCENDVTSEEFKNKCNVDYDILCGGFPCQTFSIAGKREGFLDKTKGTLFFDCAEIIKRTRPKAFLLENVKGLLSHDKGNTFNTIISVLNELDYKIVGLSEDFQNGSNINTNESKNLILNTVDFGLPQLRQRVYIVGFDKRRYGNKLKDYYSLPTGRDTIHSFDYILEDAESVSEDCYVSPTVAENTMKREKIHKQKFFRIINDKKAFYTLDTGFHKLRFGTSIILCSKAPSGYRFPTINEGAMLQGFKDYAFIENGVDKFSWDDTLSKPQKAFLLGNSVSIPVIEEIAKFMVKELNILDRG